MRPLLYSQKPALATTGEPESGTPGWIDLPCHARIWEAAGQWIEQRNEGGRLTIQGDFGVGKTFWLDEFERRFRGRRIRLLRASCHSAKGLDSESVIRQWAQEARAFIDLPRARMTPEETGRWLALAIKSMKTDGYRVITVVESSHLPEIDHLAIEETGLFFLRRKSFQGSLNQGLILAPWSNDELGEILSKLSPDLVWPEAVVERLWTLTRGYCGKAMALASQMASLDLGQNSQEMSLEILERVMAWMNPGEIGLANSSHFEFNNRMTNLR